MEEFSKFEQKNEFFYPHKISKAINQDADSPEFFKHKRHVFIFTRAGKPVFSRYGDEIKLSTFIASMSTIIEKLQRFHSADTQQTILRSVQGKNNQIFFQFRGQLIYVCISIIPEDSQALIKIMLDFLNLSIVSLVTDQVNQKLKKREQYDPRSLLSGTTNSLITSIKNSIVCPGIFSNSYACLPLALSCRNQIQNILKDNRHPDIIFQILVTPINVIAAYLNKNYELFSQDILILLNTIQANSSLRTQENWMPICLPGISVNGFVQAYINFFSKNIGYKQFYPYKILGIISITTEITGEMFHGLSSLCKNIQQLFKALKEFKLIDQINSAIELLPLNLDNYCKLPNIKNLFVKHLHQSQFVFSSFNIFGKTNNRAKQIVRKYASIYDKYQQYLNQSLSKQYFFIEKLELEQFVLYSNNDYCIIFLTDPFFDNFQIEVEMQNILKFLKDHEGSIFMKFN